LNLVDLRNEIYRTADWAPAQSTDAVTRVNGFINRAQRILASDAPFAFHDGEGQIYTQADFVPSLSGDTVTLESEGVLVRDIVRPADTTQRWVDTTKDWSGRLVEVQVGDFWYRHRIREAWYTAGDTLERMSLFPIVRQNTYVNATYRVYTDVYPLPCDVVDLKSARLFKAGETTPLISVGRDEAEKLSFLDMPQQIASGKPRNFYRGPAFQLQAPTLAPAIVAGINWTGAEPGGAFEYCYTYAWGLRDAADVFPGYISPSYTGEAVMEKPLWESPPSPTTTVTITHGAAGARLNLPDVDHMQGFATGALPTGRSGWRKRIYRKRTTAVGGTASVETPAAFYLIGETGGETTSWYDTGANIPDYHTRLPDNHGYFSIGFYPRPDDRYAVDLRYTRRPPELVDDQDTPLVHEEATEALLNRALAMLYESEGNWAAADRALGRYKEDLRRLSNRYASDVPGSVVRQRTPATGRGSRRTLRKWYE